MCLPFIFVLLLFFFRIKSHLTVVIHSIVAEYYGRLYSFWPDQSNPPILLFPFQYCERFSQCDPHVCEHTHTHEKKNERNLCTFNLSCARNWRKFPSSFFRLFLTARVILTFYVRFVCFSAQFFPFICRFHANEMMPKSR